MSNPFWEFDIWHLKLNSSKIISKTNCGCRLYDARQSLTITCLTICCCREKKARDLTPWILLVSTVLFVKLKNFGKLLSLCDFVIFWPFLRATRHFQQNWKSFTPTKLQKYFISCEIFLFHKSITFYISTLMIIFPFFSICFKVFLHQWAFSDITIDSGLQEYA